MPCRDGGPCCDYGAQHVDRVYKDKLDKVTRMLCEVLTQHEATPDAITPSVELWEWWIAHKEEDRKRAAAVDAAKRQEEQSRRDRIAELENELARLREQR